LSITIQPIVPLPETSLPETEGDGPVGTGAGVGATVAELFTTGVWFFVLLTDELTAGEFAGRVSAGTGFTTGDLSAESWLPGGAGVSFVSKGFAMPDRFNMTESLSSIPAWELVELPMTPS
jgi:hypothetical protein